MEMKIVLENILHILYKNRPKHRHILIILKYTKCKKRLDNMIFLYIKQHLFKQHLRLSSSKTLAKLRLFQKSKKSKKACNQEPLLMFFYLIQYTITCSKLSKETLNQCNEYP